MLGLKRLVSVCLFFAFASQGRTQIRMSYVMGVVGNAGGTEKIFSGSVLVEGGSCFLMTNGVSIIKYKAVNLFNTNCFLVPSFQSLQLAVFPNPFHEKVTIKSSSAFDYTTAVMYDLHLYNVAGVRIKSFTTSIYVLRSGYEISVPFLAAGTYYLKVQMGQMHIQTLTLIKTK